MSVRSASEFAFNKLDWPFRIPSFSQSRESLWKRVLKVVCLAALLFSPQGAVAQNCGSCPPPGGNYKQQCRVTTVQEYNNPSQCLYFLNCIADPRLCLASRKSSLLIISREEGCPTHWENCGGVILPRNNSTSLCTDYDSARKEICSMPTPGCNWVAYGRTLCG